jgi:hypothetical protein
VKQFDMVYQGVKSISSVKRVPQASAAAVNALTNVVNQYVPAYFEGKITLNALIHQLQAQGAQALKTAHG